MKRRNDYLKQHETNEIEKDGEAAKSNEGFSRREFLKKAATGCIALMVLPRLAP